jgi:serine protease Do
MMMKRSLRLLTLVLPAFLFSSCTGAAEGPARPAEVAARAPSAETFQEVVAAVLPAIAHIQVEARGRLLPMGQTVPQQGTGSGVLFRPDGYILTNDHVVQQAQRVTVTLFDRRQFEARVVARDPATDLAVVRIEGRNLPHAPLGNSDDIRLGDWVMALGSPLGLEFTVTSGIVSGTGRALNIIGRGPAAQELGAAPLEAFIQTDAAINPGNSGGPLVNLAGEVIGINTAIASPTGVFAGYGFAVPSNIAARVADQLIAHGEVRRPYLGVLLDNVDGVDAEVYGLRTPVGVALTHVEPDGPAGRAGLELGDVILSIAGRNVGTVSELQSILAQIEPGRVPVRFVRYGNEMTRQVELGVVRSGIVPAAPPEPATAADVGFAVADVRGQTRISAVRRNSPAARAGVAPGLIVVSVNRRPVAAAPDVERALAATRRDIVSLVVADDRGNRTIINFRAQ